MPSGLKLKAYNLQSSSSFTLQFSVGERSRLFESSKERFYPQKMSEHQSCTQKTCSSSLYKEANLSLSI